MSPARKYDNSEDMFADTRMSFGEHIEDLRRHLIRAIVGFLIALFCSFFVANWVLEGIKAPVKKELAAYYAKRASKRADEVDEGMKRGDEKLAALNKPIDLSMSFDRLELARKLLPEKEAKRVADEASLGEQVEITAKVKPLGLALKLQSQLQQLTPPHDLFALSITEAFMAWFKVALICGLVVGSPWIFIQIWAFVAAGLYPHEKRYVNFYLPVSVGLFLAGVAMCYWLILPKAIQALLWFNEWVGLEPLLRFNEWLGFAIILPVMVGLSFQLPLVMLFMERIGLFTVQSYVRKWKIALFVIHVIAAIGPTVDPISMELIALPMFGLYWLGIALCKFKPRSSELDIEVPSPEEMVEV